MDWSGRDYREFQCAVIVVSFSFLFIEQKWDAKAMRDAFKKKIENRQ